MFESASFRSEQSLSRAAAETDNDFSLFNSTMNADSILSRKPIQEASPGMQSWQSGIQPALFNPRVDRRPSPWGSPTDVSTNSSPLPRPLPNNGDRGRPAPPQEAPRQDIPRPIPRPEAPRAPQSTDGPWDKAPGAPWNKAPGAPWNSGDSRSDNAPPRSGGRNADEASAAFDRDKVTRSAYSFNDAVQKNVALGKENEVALEMQMRDWLGKQNSMNPITHMRGTAVLASALGQFRLEEGSRIDLSSHADKKPRILKGYDYDFGGEANIWLRMAAGSLVAAQQYVTGHKGLVIEGQAMDDTYLQQLKNLQTDVERKLDVIYGPHDIEAVYAKVREQVRSQSGDWQQGLVRLKYQLDGLKSNDNRYVAKSARDVALGFLAEADYMSSKNNGEEAKIMYRSANDYLAMSQRLDGSAPDNYALAGISTRLKPQIQKSLDNQWNDPFNNPFEIPNPNTVMV